MKKRFTRHLLRWKDKIWSKIHNKEFMMYVLLGATTTILNLFSYDVLCIVLDYWLAISLRGFLVRYIRILQINSLYLRVDAQMSENC